MLLIRLLTKPKASTKDAPEINFHKEGESSWTTQITAIYCLCDDVLKALHHYEDLQCQITDAEVMSTAIVAVLFFGGTLSTTDHCEPTLDSCLHLP